MAIAFLLISLSLLGVLSVFIVHRKYCCRRVSVSISTFSTFLGSSTSTFYKVAHRNRLDFMVIQVLLDLVLHIKLLTYCAQFVNVHWKCVQVFIIQILHSPFLHDCSEITAIACFPLKSSVSPLLLVLRPPSCPFMPLPTYLPRLLPRLSASTPSLSPPTRGFLEIGILIG